MFFKQLWVKFFPFIIVFQIWLMSMVYTDSFSNFANYWQGSVSMIIGSFISGSTPLGGGIVAFPVTIFVFGFDSQMSRDVSVMIQSIGMSSASYLLLTNRLHYLDKMIIVKSVLYNTFGVIIGFWLNVSSYISNVIYTVVIFEFAVVYWLNRNEKSKCYLKDQFIAREIILFFVGVFGGFLTINIGSGSDLTTYIYMIYFSDIEEFKCISNSVIVMASLSVITTGFLLTSKGFDEEVINTWSVMVPIVALGAPTGSSILKPKYEIYIKYLFYFLAVLQLILFGIFKIKGDYIVWAIIVVLFILILVSFHIKKNISVKEDSVTEVQNETM
jgi:uncharacterized protein